MSATDHSRMIAVAAGELAVMSEIYHNQRRALLRFFFRLTGKQALAEDLVHEVFLRMIRYRDTYETEGTGPKRSTTSAAMTGWCGKAWFIRSPPTGTWPAGGVPRWSFWK